MMIIIQMALLGSVRVLRAGDYFVRVRSPFGSSEGSKYDPGAYGLTVELDAGAAFTYETEQNTR